MEAGFLIKQVRAMAKLGKHHSLFCFMLERLTAGIEIATEKENRKCCLANLAADFATVLIIHVYNVIDHSFG